MEIKDFKKGQKVCVEILKGGDIYRYLPEEKKNSNDIYLNGEVVSVGRKYVDVKVENSHYPIKFDSSHDFFEAVDFSPRYRLLMSKSDAMLFILKKALFSNIAYFFERKHGSRAYEKNSDGRLRNN